MAQKRRNQHTGARPHRIRPFTRPTITAPDVEQIHQIMKKQCGWDVKEFQMQALRALANGRDVLVHAGTGYGKTAIFAGLHMLPVTKGMMSIITSPLISLQNEQVRTFKTEFGLSAVAVNSSHGGCSDKILLDIAQGKYQIVIISPEMLQSRRFIRRILQRADITNRILHFGVDETHCVSLWGDSFRKKYATLGNIRSFLPRATPVIAVSATLPPRVKRDVILRLHLAKDYLFLDMGNDRPNISIVVRPMVYAMNTFQDLSFVIPPTYTCPEDIPKTVIFCDNIDEGHQMIDFLTSLLHPSHRQMGFIRPFNATHSHEYRAKVMDAFAKGEVFILICTDLFGMGCNLPDIRLSVQWKRPSSVSSFVQRAGRAARGPGTKGLAVLLVEASAYQAKKAPAPKAGRSKGKRKTKSQPNAAVPPIEPGSEFPDSFDALISKSSSATCRRKSILGIFGHEGSGRPTVPCCDVCCPELLELVKPRGHTKKRKAKANLAVRGVVQPVVQNALLRWRDDMLAQHHPHAAYASDVILPDSAIDLLASVGPIDSLEYLKELLQMDGWYWWEKHGARLFDFLSSVTIPPLEPLPTVPIATSGHLKRPISVLEDQPVTSHPPSSRQAPVPAQSVSTAITAHSTPQPATKRPRPSTTTPAIGPRLVSQSHPSQVVQGTPQPTPPVWPPKLIPPVTPHPQARGPPTSFWPTPLPTPRPQVMSSSSTSFPSFKDPNAADYLRAFQAFHSQQVPPPATPK